MLVSKLVVLKVSQSVLIATEEQSDLHLELAGPPRREQSKALWRAQRMAAFAGSTLPVAAFIAARRHDDIRRVASGPEPHLRHLNGATLLFPDMDSSAMSDLRELQKLRNLGVNAVVTPSATNEDLFIRLELRHFSRLRKLLNASYLSLHAVARYACPGSYFSRVFFTKPYRVSGNRWETPPLKAIRCVEEGELCEQFALLEGITQMPPLPVMHADIATRGAGRYSVWNGQVLFSPLTAGKRPFMLVPRNRWTEPFLEFVSETSSAGGEIGAKLKNEPPVGFTKIEELTPEL